jgi:hypothetical protein
MDCNKKSVSTIEFNVMKTNGFLLGFKTVNTLDITYSVTTATTTFKRPSEHWGT